MRIEVTALGLVAILLCSLVLLLVGCTSGHQEATGSPSVALKSLTPPQGRDAQPVIQALHTYLEAFNRGDWQGVMAAIADDAKIESRAAHFSVLDKPGFGEVIKPLIAEGVKGWVEDARVIMSDATHAQVTGIYLMTGRSVAFAAGHRWEFERRGDRWLLVRTTYV